MGTTTSTEAMEPKFSVICFQSLLSTVLAEITAEHGIDLAKDLCHCHVAVLYSFLGDADVIRAECIPPVILWRAVLAGPFCTTKPCINS